MKWSAILKRLRGARLSRVDHLAFSALLLAALVLAAKGWLDAHPQHNPWAPLDLRDPPGWATQTKIAALRSDAAVCRGVLERSDIAFDTLDPAGEGACAPTDRTVLSQAPLRPNVPPTTCAVAAGMEIWLRDAARPAAQEELGSPLASIEHYGAYSCRRMYSRDDAPWSEHATGNAIDVAAFVLENGRRITVLRDWDGDDVEARFLRRVRDGACGPFATVLGPEYNAAHRDHFHFDQAARGLGGVCR